MLAGRLLYAIAHNMTLDGSSAVSLLLD